MISEVSVLLRDAPMEFARALKVLADANINVNAFSVDRAGPYSNVRLITNDPNKTYEELAERKFSVERTEVFAIRLPNKPGQLERVCSVMGNAGINIDYGYTSGSAVAQDAVVFLRTKETTAATTLLRDNGLQDLSDVSQLP